MAWKWADDIRETSLSAGSPWTPAGAEPGFKAVSTFLSNGDTSDFTIRDASGFETGEYSYDSALNKLTLVTLFESSNGNSPVSWGGGSKTVACAPLAYRFRKLFDAATGDANRIRFDAAQSLTAAQQAQGRANLSAAQIAAMAAHNVVINGGVDVSQELGTTGATLANNIAKYTADMIEAMYNHGAATAVVTSGQVATSSFAGFSFAHQIKATTAITSPANGDFAKHRLKIEGNRIAKWGWGAAGAASIVVACELNSTASGTVLLRLSNGAGNRFYHHELTVAAGVNFYAFTVPGDTSGTWATDITTGLVVELFSCGKETTPGSTLDSWTATGTIQTTNSGNLLGTNNNLTQLTGIYIDIGTQLPVVADLPGLMRPFDQELFGCKRYYEKLLFMSNSVVPMQAINTTDAYGYISFTDEKRATPTMSQTGTWQVWPSNAASANTTLTVGFSSTTGARVAVSGTTGAPLVAGNAANLFAAATNAIIADARL